MIIKKCDICHKTIKEKTGLKVCLDFFKTFELCPNCAKPIAKFLKAKRLIKDKQLRQPIRAARTNFPKQL